MHSEYPQPRHGQGMFIEAIKMVHNIRSPDIDLEYKQYGKPYAVTYEYADNLLQQLMKKKSNSTENPMVVMVGDNPDSDIQGANNFGWQSALVRTGVYKHGIPKHEPSVIVDNVLKAVEWAIEQR